MASYLYENAKPKSNYYFKNSKLSPEEYAKKLLISSTLYVGNLAINTNEDSIYELFSRCGNLQEVKMGLNKKGEPAGFCFVIFATHDDASYAAEYLNQAKLDDRIIRVDWDIGYTDDRKYGRGFQGHQWRDTLRETEDPGRPNVNKQWVNSQYKQKFNNQKPRNYDQNQNRKYDQQQYKQKRREEKARSSDSEVEEENYRHKKRND